MLSRFATWAVPKRGGCVDAMRKRHFFLVSLVVLAVAVGSCGKLGDEVEITGSLKRSESEAPVKVGATSDERFRVASPEPSSAGAAQAPFHWSAPEGWQEQAPTQYRLANFRVGPNQEGECYLTVLGGGGGGAFANVNRWRGQMGLSAYTQEEFDDLEKVTVLGQQAIHVDFEGSFSGMGGGQAAEGFRLLGTLLEYEGQGVFLKMVGPKEALEKERENFHAFASSLHAPAGHDHGAAQSAQSNDSTDEHAEEQTSDPTGAGSLPPGHPPTEAASADVVASVDVAAVVPKTSGQGYRWEAPEGWNQGPERSMRLVTYTVGGAECYVTLLGGQAGGMAMNINRWVGQIGKPALSEAEIESLPKIEVLGESVPLLDLTGAYGGMDGQATGGQGLLGVARIEDEGSLFVKMTGPESEVLAQKDNFIAFCQSITSD